MNQMMAKVVSVGIALPENVRDNAYYEARLDTSDEWISQRTGIKTRRIWENAPADACAELGAQAAQNALERAGIDASGVDTIICATFTPDSFFPATAVGIAEKLGLKGTFAFDLSAACSGFVFGLTVADSLIRSGQSKRVLLVGSEIISRSLDFTDRNTCLLFGDGAGAVVIEAAEGDRGVLACSSYTNGAFDEDLALPAWDKQQYLTMNGKIIYKQAVQLMPSEVQNVLTKTGMSVDDLDLLIPHQANIRIIEKVGSRLGIDPEKVIVNVDKYGNTSSATIPLALFDAWEAGRIKEGTVVAFTALGGGLTAGAAIVRF